MKLGLSFLVAGMLGSVFGSPTGSSVDNVPESAPAEYVPHRYFIKYKESATDEQVENHKHMLQTRINPQHEEIHYQFSFDGFRGVSGTFSEDTLLAAADDSIVEYTEPVGIARTADHDNVVPNNEDKDVVETPVEDDDNGQEDLIELPEAMRKQSGVQNWGLARIWQRKFHDKKTYVYPDSAGHGATVYVIDTGIMVEHPEFEGRASWGFVAQGYQAKDGNGHGTHCAGIVASKTYGVAKKARVVAVKVLSDSGSGTFDSVVSGIIWSAQHARSHHRHGLITMSLGGQSSSRAVIDAVAAAFNSGVPVMAAAGNSKSDACGFLPASAPKAFAVTASDINDRFATFSNFGPCTKLIAPGVQITSTWNDGAVRTISGTSMSTPFVAGVAALYTGHVKLAPQKVYDLLRRRATKNVIQGVPANTPNALLHI